MRAKTMEQDWNWNRGKRNAIAMSKSLFALAAGASFLLSVALYFSGSREQGIFVGLWVPSILSAGTLLHARGVR